MPTYRAKEKGYHDDIVRMPGAVFASEREYDCEKEMVVTVTNDNGKKEKKKQTVYVPMPSWMELVSKGEDVPTTSGVNREATIINAMKDMVVSDPEANDPEMWIGSGAPEIKELVKRTDIADISAKERDELWGKVHRPASGKTAIQ